MNTVWPVTAPYGGPLAVWPVQIYPPLKECCAAGTLGQGRTRGSPRIDPHGSTGLGI